MVSVVCVQEYGANHGIAPAAVVESILALLGAAARTGSRPYSQVKQSTVLRVLLLVIFTETRHVANLLAVLNARVGVVLVGVGVAPPLVGTVHDSYGFCTVH